MQAGHGDGENDADDRTADGEPIRDDHMVQIDESGADQERDEDHTDRGDGWRELPPAGEEKKAGQQFDQGVADAESAITTAAATPQEEPAEDRDIVEPRDWTATGALGSRSDDRTAFRYPIDAYIKKTPDDGAEDEGESEEEPGKLLIDGGEFDQHGVAAV